MTKNTVEIKILEHRLSLKSDMDQAYVDEVAGFVEKEMKKIQTASKSVSSMNIALLACMNIAGEYIRLQEMQRSKTGKVNKKMKDLIAFIDKQL